MSFIKMKTKDVQYCVTKITECKFLLIKQDSKKNRKIAINIHPHNTLRKAFVNLLFLQWNRGKNYPH